MDRLAVVLGRLGRFLRTRRARWDADGDRRFHDQIFDRSDYDPFDPAYPGNISIRRFADLASEHVAGRRHVADLGCGPGEITCELAARFPDISFVGVDHSASAIDRARQLAESRGVANVSFEREDVSSLRVDDSVGLVTMFDAFHHLLEPAAFLSRNAHVPRWFLIEPAGDSLGRWRYAYDLDWLLLELDKLRWRLEHQLGMKTTPSTQGPDPVADAAAAVEFRYGLAEYEALFAGYGFKVRGTTSGLIAYPPGPKTSTHFKGRFTDYAYQVLCAVDDQLLVSDQDLLARHWAIYCARGETFPKRQRPPTPHHRSVGEPLQGPYGVEYTLRRGLDRMPAGSQADVVIDVTNRGFLPWPTSGDTPVHASYHWRDRHGRRVVLDGLRTPLARPVASGETITTNVVVQAPSRSGRLVLDIDLVHEGVTWFSQAGQPMLSLDVRVE